MVTVTRKNPVTSAAFLVIHFFALSGLYLTLQAQLLAILQLLVYAGAIMVLVVFVIMLLNIGNEEKSAKESGVRQGLALVFSMAFVLQLFVVFLSKPTSYQALAQKAGDIGTVEALGKSMFTTYMFPFEAVSLLLLSAIVGAILLSKRKLQA